MGSKARDLKARNTASTVQVSSREQKKMILTSVSDGSIHVLDSSLDESFTSLVCLGLIIIVHHESVATLLGDSLTLVYLSTSHQGSVHGR